jgi:hypothetical protein
MESPSRGQVIECPALRRKVTVSGGVEVYQWLLCTGSNMGRWTLWFGPWNLAGDWDSRAFVEAQREMNRGSEIVTFEIHCTSPLLDH